MWILYDLPPLKFPFQAAAHNLFRCIPLRHCSTSMAHLRADAKNYEKLPIFDQFATKKRGFSWIFQVCYTGM